MKPTVQIKLGLFSIHLIRFGKMRHLIWLLPALLAVASVSASSAGSCKAARAIEIETNLPFTTEHSGAGSRRQLSVLRGGAG